MPRKAKGVHTSPENAGEQNLPDGYAEKNHDDMNTVEKLIPMYKKGVEYLQEYKGLWTDEQLQNAINDFFTYCAENDIKPAKAGLRLWLGISSSQYYDWTNKPDKYGSKSALLESAHGLMEMCYILRGEQFPTFNMFLLKAAHGMVETNKVEISTNGQVNKDEVKETISKLGLDE